MKIELDSDLVQSADAFFRRKWGAAAADQLQAEVAKRRAEAEHAAAHRKRQPGEFPPDASLGAGVDACQKPCDKAPSGPAAAGSRRGKRCAARRRPATSSKAQKARERYERYCDRLAQARAGGVIVGLRERPWPSGVRRKSVEVQRDAIARVRWLKAQPHQLRRAILLAAHRLGDRCQCGALLPVRFVEREDGVRPEIEPCLCGRSASERSPWMRGEHCPAAIAFIAFLAGLLCASEESGRRGRWRSVSGLSRKALAALGPVQLSTVGRYSTDMLRIWLRRAEAYGLLERVQPPPSAAVHIGPSGWSYGQIFFWPPVGIVRSTVLTGDFDITVDGYLETVLSGPRHRSGGRGLWPPWMTERGFSPPAPLGLEG